jgi:two-component system copper resistance phosphate regulon response regulator CusR
MRVLLIEDEKKAVSYISKGLRENDFIVDVAEDGELGLHLARTGHYDLIVLDVMLPKLDGWTVLSELRRSGNTTLTLFLTAKDAVQDRVYGLDIGADAYLVKPFAFSELMAFIRSLLRRGPIRHSEVLKIADLEVNLVTRRVTREGKRVDLSPKEYALLVLLMRRHGEVLTRSAIAEQVWDINFDSDTNVVDVNIRRLRSKIDDSFELKLISTIRGVGYVLRYDP